MRIASQSYIFASLVPSNYLEKVRNYGPVEIMVFIGRCVNGSLAVYIRGRSLGETLGGNVSLDLGLKF